MYILSNCSIFSLVSFLNKTGNYMYNVLNICCSNFPSKYSWGKKLPHASDGVTGSSPSDGGLGNRPCVSSGLAGGVHSL